LIYKVELSDRAAQDIREIANPSIRKQLMDKLTMLATHPDLGKRLGGELQGLYSLRASRSRYRIIYKVEDDTVQVLVVRIGIRKGKDRDDVYQALKRELRRKGGLS